MWDQFPGVVQCREDEQIGEDPRLIQDEGMLGVQPRPLMLQWTRFGIVEISSQFQFRKS